MLIHPAHTLHFDDLLAGLKAARDERQVYERPGPDGLVLWLYSERCVYESQWHTITIAARGLILDMEQRRIAATPFPKFFNAGERGESAPDLPFTATDKLDGSLIIIFHHRGRWRTATKGAFASAQAKWAQARLDAHDLTALTPGVTYLAEATYPENKVVVYYAEPSLRLLAAYRADGVEMHFDAVVEVGAATGLGHVQRREFRNIGELLTTAKALPRSEEGYVVRFDNGLRLKIKGDEYKRIHALIAGLTPLNIWQAMASGDDMQAIRRDLPEEFWADFDALTGILQGQVDTIISAVTKTAKEVESLSDKEVGLAQPKLVPLARPFIFAYRKSGGDLLNGRPRDQLFRSIRPTGNELPGYQPSSAMNRLVEEAG